MQLREVRFLMREVPLYAAVLGYTETGIHTPMAQGRSTQIISMIKWIRTRLLSIKKSLCTQLRIVQRAGEAILAALPLLQGQGNPTL